MDGWIDDWMKFRMMNMQPECFFETFCEEKVSNFNDEYLWITIIITIIVTIVTIIITIIITIIVTIITIIVTIITIIKC